jgi:lipoprotein-anchoring transpeptidase ErfK/SrfK
MKDAGSQTLREHKVNIMNTNIIQAREFVANAREALRRGDNDTARDFGEKAALLAPDMEDAWLILVASDANPEDALAYARKALELNPQSPRARKSVEWAEDKLNQTRAGREAVAPQPVMKPVVKSEPKKANPPVESKSNKRILLYGGTFGLLVCIVFGFAAWSAVSSPAFASIVDNAPAPTQENLWAQVNIAKPSVTPIDASAFAQASTPTPAPVTVPPTATLAVTDVPTSVPTSVPTDAPTPTPAATETPGVMALDILVDTPTSAYVPPTAAPQTANEQPASSYPAKGNGVRWIDVNLSQQMVYAYEGDVIVNSFVVSTGTAQTPTVTGKYKIWIKLKSTTMSGPGYHLTNVPYTMYFYKGYGLHGTYWHNNFGTPMSHGCVNLSIPDAEWLYYWAMEGTVVNVHY